MAQQGVQSHLEEGRLPNQLLAFSDEGLRPPGKSTLMADGSPLLIKPKSQEPGRRSPTHPEAAPASDTTDFNQNSLGEDANLSTPRTTFVSSSLLGSIRTDNVPAKRGKGDGFLNYSAPPAQHAVSSLLAGL